MACSSCADSCSVRLLLCCLLVLCTLIGYSNGAKAERQAPSCPGIVQGQCRRSCQLAVCKALVEFYTATVNSTHPWKADGGWMAWTNSTMQLCEDIVSLGPEHKLHYCSWHGVSCCHEELAVQQHCSNLHAVRALDLQVNGLTGSVDNPQFTSSLLQLHACGVTKLQLSGNELGGNMRSEAWGRLINLTYLDLANNNIDGTIPSALRHLKHLTRLSLGTNQLHGSLPNWLGELPDLETLNLGANTGRNPGRGQGLTGTLPASLALLSNLTVLNLELNALVGVLPQKLCHSGSKLRALKLQGNRLTGSVNQLVDCTSLTQLDISSNRFSGVVQLNSSSWSQLAVLDASNNAFEGSIPVELYELPVLEYLNLANNRFSGQIRRHITLTIYLKELNLEHNMLTGPIDNNIWLLPHLRLLDLSHNSLSGTISHEIGHTFNLEELQLSNNNLSGPLPPQIGFLKKVDLINIAQNPNLSCLPASTALLNAQASPSNTSTSSSRASSYQDSGAHCRDRELLPCFLYFSNYTLPRTDASNMACPAVLRREYAEAAPACSGEGHTQLGKLAHNIADAMADDQSWKIEPRYYQYKGCQCLPGFEEFWLNNRTVLVCVPVPPPKAPSWVKGLIQAMSVSGAMLLAAVALLVWLRMAVQLRPRWQREKELNECRRKGMPCGGPATIVVTDIEKYSELMAANAPLATKALGIHNSILRRACACHAGHVVEQEGDSWSVAFHTPMDAVAFCLQVQQALDRTNWPSDLGVRLHTSKHTSSDLDGPVAVIAAHKHWESSQLDKTSQHNINTNTMQPAVPATGSPTAQQLQANRAMAAAGKGLRKPGWVRVAEGTELAAWHGNSSADTKQPASLKDIAGAESTGLYESPFAARQASGSSSSSSSGGGGEQLSSSLAVGHHNINSSMGMESRADSSSCSGALTLCESTATPITGPDTASGWGIAGRTRRNSNGGRSSRFWSIIGLNAGSMTRAQTAQDHMQGLRVRMGVARGFVPHDTNIARCALLELAKGVSDMAAGGQVLLEAGCFAGVRDRLTELGGVDHRGYNDITLAHAARAAMRQQTSGLLCNCMGMVNFWLGRRSDGSLHDSDALLLDMGEFYVPHLAPVIPAAAGASTDASVSSLRCDDLLTAAGTGNAAMAAAAAASAAGLAGSSSLMPQTLQLYSILPRSLSCRAKHWMGRLSFKEGTQQNSSGYFDAPGTDVAELALPAPAAFASSPLRCPLPCVTMVFAAVEGGSSRVHRRHDVARVVHNTLSKVMQALLLALPERDGRRDGYLCRQQEGELKYMLAFREPARALEWCLLVQEVLLHLPWPQQVLEAFEAGAAAEGRTSSSSTAAPAAGHPCLSMGLSEGQPQAIGPDHLGRADYHGPSVNLAARMMAAAASGGQVVTSSELAQGIFSTWCYEAELVKCHQLPLASVAPKQLDTDAAARAVVPITDRQLQADPAAAAAHIISESTDQQQLACNSGSGHGCLAASAQPLLAACRSSGQLPSSGGRSGGVHAAGGSSSPSKLPAHRQPDSDGLLPSPQYPQHQVHVSGWHIGTFIFKGCGAVEMVTFTTDSLGVLNPPATAAAPRGSKGMLLHPRSGPVVGLQNCPALLPNVLPSLQQAWQAAAQEAAAAEHSRVLQQGQQADPYAPFQEEPDTAGTFVHQHWLPALATVPTTSGTLTSSSDAAGSSSSTPAAAAAAADTVGPTGVAPCSILQIDDAV